MSSARYPSGYMEALDSLIHDMVNLSEDTETRTYEILFTRERVTAFVRRWGAALKEHNP